MKLVDLFSTQFLMLFEKGVFYVEVFGHNFKLLFAKYQSKSNILLSISIHSRMPSFGTWKPSSDNIF